MSFYDEYLERKKNREQSSGYSSFWDGYLDRQIKRGAINLNDVMNTLSSDVQKWSDSHNAYVTGHNERYNNTGYRSDSQAWLDSSVNTQKELSSQAEKIRKQIETYNRYLDPKWVSEIQSYLDSAATTQKSLLDYDTADVEYWSQWSDADDYNFVQSLHSGDTESAVNALENMKTTRDQFNPMTYNFYDRNKKVKEYSNLLNYMQENGLTTLKEYEAKREEEQKKFAEEEANLLANYNTIKDKNRLKSAIEEWGGYVNSLSEYYLPQEHGLTTQGSKTPTKHNNPINKGRDVRGFVDGEEYVGAAYIEALERSIKRRDDEYAYYRVISASNPWSNLYDPDFEKYVELGKEYVDDDPKIKGIKNEEHLTDDELDYIRYCFAKDAENLQNGTPSNLLEGYLSSRYLQEELTKREGAERAEWLKDHRLLTGLYLIPVSLDNVVSGFKGMFSDEYIPPSATQYAGEIIREDLVDKGPIKWDGGSLYQVLWDVGTSAGQMLPSVLVAAAVEALLPTVGEGAVVFGALNAHKIAAATGSLVLGASAMGNAKQEMLSLGYSPKQANAYGLLVGASEVGLSYLLSGIPGLRGGNGVASGLATKAVSKVDNTLARVAISLGDAFDEGIEEGLQTVLEHWFKEIVTGVDFEAPDAEEILYNSLIGMLTSGGFNVAGKAIGSTVGTISNYFDIKKAGKAFQNNLAKGGSSIGDVTSQVLGINNQKSAFAKGTDAYKNAQKIQSRLDNGKKTRNYSIGKLARSMSESQMSSAIQTRLSSHVSNESDRRSLSRTIVDIALGRKVNDRAISKVMDNTYAFNALNDVLGAKLKKGSSLSAVKNAIAAYQKQGANSKNTASGNVKFSMNENQNGEFEVIASADGQTETIGAFKSRKKAEATVYAMTLGLGPEGMQGFVSMSGNISADMGDAALVYNAIYMQGKRGKAFSAVNNMNLLSPEQRQLA